MTSNHEVSKEKDAFINMLRTKEFKKLVSVVYMCLNVCFSAMRKTL